MRINVGHINFQPTLIFHPQLSELNIHPNQALKAKSHTFIKIFLLDKRAVVALKVIHLVLDKIQGN
jgi:hypothetical protein